jgi:hypothetical protein
LQCAPPIAEAKKEPDPSKEFVDGIMAEMALKIIYYFSDWIPAFKKL